MVQEYTVTVLAYACLPAGRACICYRKQAYGRYQQKELCMPAQLQCITAQLTSPALPSSGLPFERLALSCLMMFDCAFGRLTSQCGDDNNIPRTDWPLVEAMQTYIYP